MVSAIPAPPVTSLLNVPRKTDLGKDSLGTSALIAGTFRLPPGRGDEGSPGGSPLSPY